MNEVSGITICQSIAVATVLVAQPLKTTATATNDRSPDRETEQTQKEGKNDMKGAKDFDFLIGEWRVQHRRLKERLANNHEWIEFAGTCAARKILGGLGSTDDNVLAMPGRAYSAVTLRTYDRANDQWSIWWIDSRYPGGPIDPPVVGRFENGVGTFYADDNFKGRPIRVRFLWSQSSTAPHWEQAFSTDDGKTWETNWTMDFTKSDVATLQPRGRASSGDRERKSDFDSLIGDWRVRHRRLKERLANNQEWIEFDGTIASRKILGGVGIIDDNVLNMPGGGYSAVTVRTYDSAKDQWTIWWIDSRNPGQIDPPVVGRFENGVGTLYSDDNFKGKPIRVRAIYSHLSTGPHWEQAFSTDGGKTWETNWTMDFTRTAINAQSCCPVVELRQYTLKPNQRDVLIELFEREFIDSQEATGMRVIGTFRDLNNPDRFVWLRGFSDMPARANALKEFYDGPVWKAHGDAANATMIDSDNVLLLRPARPNSGFSLANVTRRPRGSTDAARGLLVATIYHLGGMDGTDVVDLFERELVPIIEQTGATIAAWFVTENHPNTFPRLPVREDANVFVWFSLFADGAAWEKHAVAFAHSIREEQIEKKGLKMIKGPPEVLMLAPTARSLLALE